MINRRGLLGFLAAAPIAAPAAIKAAMAEQPYTVGEVIAQTIYSPWLPYGAADLGTITTGIISNADGSFVIDCARNMIVRDADDVEVAGTEVSDEYDFDDDDWCDLDEYDDDFHIAAAQGDE